MLEHIIALLMLSKLFWWSAATRMTEVVFFLYKMTSFNFDQTASSKKAKGLSYPFQEYTQI